MKPGRHAAADGSFGRSAGAAGGRGFALIAVALLLGTLVLNATDDDPPGARLTTGSTPSDEQEPDGGDGATTTLPEITSTTTLPLRPPAEVKLLVVNGTRTRGAAGKVNDKLKPAGYNALAPTDATAAEVSSVFYELGFEREAAAVASLLQLPASTVKPMPTPVPVRDGNLRGANVLVVVGPELATGVAGAPATTSTTRATTSTTARSATTTTARPATTTTTR